MRKPLIALIVLLIFGIISFFWWTNGTAAVDKNNKTEVTFIVAKGAGVREIANSLKKQGLIKDPIAFFLLVRFALNIDDKIQAGDHRLSKSMDAATLAKRLTTATNDVWVTLPEGMRAQEIADILEKDLPSYEDSWRKTLEDNEGYLFPDTYLIPKTAGIDMVLAIFKNNFKSKYDALNTNKNQEEIVTIASLIEREAKHAKDRPLVASVIYNRLDLGMKLDIDATVQYVLGYQTDEKRWWKKNLLFKDLEVNSPYNTYRNAGLPPTPIANPGIASLQAAIAPANTNYLYYIADKNGVNRYAETLEEHSENIEKYGL